MTGLDRSKFYSLNEAVKLIKERANAKFNETIELAMNLGVDPRQSTGLRTAQGLREGVARRGRHRRPPWPPRILAPRQESLP